MKERGITINGVQYEPVENEVTKSYSKHMSKIALMAMAMGGYDGYNNNRAERKLPSGINIEHEFELIQQKQSKLSRWERNLVESIFNKKYKKLDKIIS